MISISNIVDLQKIGNDPGYPLGEDYELTQDIDATATSGWNGGLGFTPIGSAYNPFYGSINGNNHSITNLYINRSDFQNIGLFGVAYGSDIRNINLINVGTNQ